MSDYARIAEVKAGDTLLADGGFTCMSEGIVTVEEDDDGLFVRCGEGKHYLDGQAEGDVYIGLSLPSATAGAA